MCVGAGDKENEESWTKVSPSKNKQQQSHAINQSDPISKFFVANIPDGCRPWDLAEVLKGFGNIAGVFIARKRNKEGVRFGFVKFKGVKDFKELEKSLQNIKIGKWTLRINIAWFARENSSLENRKGGFVRKPLNPKPRPFVSRVPDLSVNKGVSFRDVVRGNPDSLVKEMVVQVEDEFSDLSFAYNRALVARCSSFEMVPRIKMALLYDIPKFYQYTWIL